MPPTLGELFMRSRGQPVELDGREVRPVYERPLEAAQTLRLELRSSRARPEGVCVKIVKGTLLVNGQQLTEAVLWTDTAPPSVEIACRPKGKGTVLKIWNTWRDEKGTEHAWIGNAGMVVEGAGSQIVLRCSDGVGAPDFDDLVVTLHFEGAAH